jgi:hypothetical protein
MILLNGIATDVKRGYYFVQFTAGGTSATISINGLAPVALTELASTGAGYVYIALPECKITVTLTGGAQLALEPVATDAR